MGGICNTGFALKICILSNSHVGSIDSFGGVVELRACQVDNNTLGRCKIKVDLSLDLCNCIPQKQYVF